MVVGLWLISGRVLGLIQARQLVLGFLVQTELAMLLVLVSASTE
jgi:hypothetical protein